MSWYLVPAKKLNICADYNELCQRKGVTLQKRILFPRIKFFDKNQSIPMINVISQPFQNRFICGS